MTGLQNPIVVLAVLAWLGAPSHSLSEVAQKEAFRRQVMPKSRASLTNIGGPVEVPATFGAPTPAAGGAAAGPKGADATKDPKDPKDKDPKDKDNEPHDEAWWRKRIDTARQAVDRDQRSADALQTRINALQGDVVNRDSPAQQASLRKELLKALAELDNAKKMVEDDRAAIKGIQEDARRLDVPAGWVRF